MLLIGSQTKKWAGNDRKKFKNYNLNEKKDKKASSGKYAQKKYSKMKKGMKYVDDGEAEEGSEKIKKKKKKSKEEDYD